MGYVLLGCRVMLIGIFAVSLAGKVRSNTAYADFRRSVLQWRVLPPSWAATVAAGAVAGEAAAVLLLALPWTVPCGFIVAGSTLTVAAAFIGVCFVVRFDDLVALAAK